MVRSVLDMVGPVNFTLILLIIQINQLSGYFFLEKVPRSTDSTLQP